MIEALWDEDGTVHHERWVPRTEHPWIPQRPPNLWDTPTFRGINTPLPHINPQEIVLNPFLEHRIVGRPPIMFDVRYPLDDIRIRGARDEIPAMGDYPNDNFMNPYGPNGHQPATWPGVTSLPITMLADDSRKDFLWKFIVLLPSDDNLPVTVLDVLNAIHVNFDEFVTPEDLNAICPERRNITARAALLRQALFDLPQEDGIKRVDYLGFNTYFRGLEPAPDGEGFMIFFGQP
ncbi:hypothetical protein K474DRAFT_1593756 [Panus rudis PR-1116 ss-1]|nr:hypothetical protein K474DRAFT_1593756 [Panus rudis PR-1116 ss-1]